MFDAHSLRLRSHARLLVEFMDLPEDDKAWLCEIAKETVAAGRDKAKMALAVARFYAALSDVRERAVERLFADDLPAECSL